MGQPAPLQREPLFQPPTSWHNLRWYAGWFNLAAVALLYSFWQGGGALFRNYAVFSGLWLLSLLITARFLSWLHITA